MSKTNGSETRVGVFMKLRPSAVASLDAAAERLGLSRASVVEVLASQAADRLQPVAIDPSWLPADSRGKRGQGRRKPPAS